MSTSLFGKTLTALLCLIIVSLFTLTSCYGFESLDDTSKASMENTGSNTGNNTSSDDEKNKITSVYNISISGESNDIIHSTVQGLRSAVSIYCTFESTSGSSYPWNPNPTTRTYYTTGSGVIYKTEEDGSAFIITNFHVVYDSSSNTENGISDKIYLYLYGLENENYAIPASYVGGSANYDIAVLRIDKSEVLKNAINSGAASEISVGNSDKLSPGETAIAVGNPSSEGLGGLSVTSGIISVASEYITMSASDGSGEVEFRVIRTDAPVNSGNSGGGLYNAKGELIGIVNAKISDQSIENIGYALPSNVVRAVADNIIDFCYGKECESVMRGILGVTVQSTAMSTSYNTQTGLIECTEEVCVYEVSDGTPGAEILVKGDIIKSISIGNTTVLVTQKYHLIDAMLDVRAGDTVTINIERGGIEMSLSTVMTEASLSEY